MIKALLQSKAYTQSDIGMSTSDVLCFDDMVLKISENNQEAKREHDLLVWLQDKLPVPQVLEYEIIDDKCYLLMSKAQGVMACDESLMENPVLLTQILAQALKQLWQVDISNCPYNHTLDEQLVQAKYQVENHLYDLDNVQEGTFGKDGFENPEALLEWLNEHRFEEDLVFSRGDFCLPNIFIQDQQLSGLIDLGRGGIADKYQDIALCYRSLKDNYSGRYARKAYPSYDPMSLFEALEIEPDMEKVNYYILMDELF